MTTPIATNPASRTRAYERFAWDGKKADELARQVAAIRVRAYDLQLRDMVRQMGIQHGASLTDNAVLAGISQDSRAVAVGIVNTFNRDLQRFLSVQPPDLSEQQLATAVRQWADSRARWKAKQVSVTEAQQGRSLAEADVLSKNLFVVQQRAIPESAQCPICQSIVARGWQRPDQVDFKLPAHPGCAHHLESASNLQTQAQNRARVWAGGWQRTQAQPHQVAADDIELADAASLPEFYAALDELGASPADVLLDPEDLVLRPWLRGLTNPSEVD